MQEIQFTKRKFSEAFNLLYTFLGYAKKTCKHISGYCSPGSILIGKASRLLYKEYPDGDIVFSVANIYEGNSYYYFYPISIFSDNRHIKDYLQELRGIYNISIGLQFTDNLEHCYFDEFVIDKQQFDNDIVKRSKIKKSIKDLTNIVRVEVCNEIREDEILVLFKEWADYVKPSVNHNAEKLESLKLFSNRLLIFYYYYGDKLVAFQPVYLPLKGERSNDKVMVDGGKSLAMTTLSFVTDEKHKKAIKRLLGAYMVYNQLKVFFDMYPKHIWNLGSATDIFEKEGYSSGKEEYYNRIGYSMVDFFTNEILTNIIQVDNRHMAFNYDYLCDGNIVKASKIYIKGNEEWLGDYYKLLENTNQGLISDIFPGGFHVGTHTHPSKNIIKSYLFLYQLEYADGDVVWAFGTSVNSYHIPYSKYGDKEHIKELLRLFKIRNVIITDDTLTNKECYADVFYSHYDIFEQKTLKDRNTKRAIKKLSSKLSVKYTFDYLEEPISILYGKWELMKRKRGHYTTNLNIANNEDLHPKFVYITDNDDNLLAVQPIFKAGHYYFLNGGKSFYDGDDKEITKYLGVFLNYLAQDFIFRDDIDAFVSVGEAVRYGQTESYFDFKNRYYNRRVLKLISIKELVL